MGSVFRFPKREVFRAASTAATNAQIWRGRAKEALGRLLNRLGMPGAVRDTHFQDALTGDQIEVEVGELFTRLSVNGRDYYFNRITGKFDGSGFEP